jgi:subtilisin family serine protease
MNRLILSVALACVALPLSAQEVPGQDGRYLVQFRDFRGAAAIVRAAGGSPVVELAPQSAMAAYLPAQALEGLRRNPNVVLVEPDPRRYPFAQTTPYGITMVQADRLSDTNAGNVTVCIIDSGYYRAHEDLAGSNNVSGSTDSGTGLWYEDTCGHGTHVAGTIAALDNTVGVRGVLGTDKVKIRAEKVFDGATCGWSYSSTLVAALNACRTNTASSQKLVVSMSLGGSFASSVESAAFQQAYDAGVLSVAAAGNAGNRTKSYPASYPSVISVAAIDRNKNIASFSQQNNQVELSAPGVAVLSTVPFKPSTVAVGSATYLGENIEGSARVASTGSLVDGGLCDSAGAWPSKVVLCQRGVISFATKVANVVNGGGAAAVIYNNVSGGFAGTLNGTSTIPAISISMEDGQALKSAGLGKSATVDNVGGAGSGYAYYDGTSMATPHVSGVAALVWSNALGRTNAELRAALQATAEDMGPVGLDNAYGYGLVQAEAALGYLGGSTPAPNKLPTAQFSASCSELTCVFTDQSTDPDGTVAFWNWNFGDGESSTSQHPTHVYRAGDYTVTLKVTDNRSGTDTATQTVTVSGTTAGIVLSASGRPGKVFNAVDLTWSGSASAKVDVYRNGAFTTTTANDGAHTDKVRGAGTYTYKVCEAGSQTCSNTVQVVF